MAGSRPRPRFTFGSYELSPYLANDEMRRKWEQQISGYQTTHDRPHSAPPTLDSSSTDIEEPNTPEPSRLVKK